MRYAWLFLLLFGAACRCPHPDKPKDSGVAADMTDADLAASCIKCDAVINPCPARGLYCNPTTRCCDTTPH